MARGVPRGGLRLAAIVAHRCRRPPVTTQALKNTCRRCEAARRNAASSTSTTCQANLQDVLRVAVMHDTFICTVQLAAVSLLPFLAAGFDLEVSAYPVDEDPPSQDRSGRMATRVREHGSAG